MQIFKQPRVHIRGFCFYFRIHIAEVENLPLSNNELLIEDLRERFR
ncbi:hypothetical protein CACET_c26460 [Clostridium aceticum]|uniref:Uncharacterized protein n=1 Tax=Clostridium aceticum TaxID=84022 RepID=A0A0G3WBT6_9CLOT|nr:hypothetical protein CACET_c26460 [Clostridium aceticum]